MRSRLLAWLLVLSSSAGGAAEQKAAPPKGKTSMFRSAYDPPKDPKHQMFYERFKKDRVLERFAEAGAAIRLPKPLVVKFASCDGTSNAWYEPAHGLDSQRFYNVLCMAYGSNPASFKGMVDKGYLPKDRAEDCQGEFHQVAYAVKKLIDPSVDPALAARIKAAHKARWERQPTPPGTEPAK